MRALSGLPFLTRSDSVHDVSISIGRTGDSVTAQKQKVVDFNANNTTII